MESAEASGKTVEDALNRALATLGARREDVEFVVLDEGRRGGLFGRGAKDAVVRVERTASAAPVSPSGEMTDTRIPRGQSAPRGGRRGGGPGAGAPSGDRDRRPPARGGRDDRPQRQTRGGFDQPAPRISADDFMRPAGRPAGDNGDMNTEARAPRPRREGPSTRDAGPRPERGERPERSERRRREEITDIAPDINAEEVDFAAQLVDDLLRLLDIDAELNIREPLTAGDGLGMHKAVIDISGENLGLLIGRRGDTLISLQYLVNLVVGRRFPGGGGVSVDVEHYKHRREEQVVSLAKRMADRVRQTGSAITLEPMSAAERRLVHISLAEDAELETNSIGEGENRKVVISSKR